MDPTRPDDLSESGGARALRERLTASLHAFCSPEDGTELALDRDLRGFTDRQGRRFPIVEGVPLLIPRLDAFLRDHARVSRASGAPPPLLSGSIADIAAAVARGPVVGFALGFPITIRAVDDPRAESGREPGSLFEDPDGRVRLAGTDGSLAVSDLRAESRHFGHFDWRSIRAALRLEPPFQLLEEPFPDVIISNYFETVLFVAQEDVRRLTAGEPPRELGERSVPPADVLCTQNVPFLEWLFTTYALPVDAFAALDIGCGSGFLTRAAELAGARIPVGTDLRFQCLETQHVALGGGSSRLTLALADMFQWCYRSRAFAFVALRNNSAHAKAPRLDERFDRLHGRVTDALVDGGLGYLTAVTDGSRRLSTEGMANPHHRDLVESIERGGAEVLKLMRVGSCFGALFARPGERELARRTRVAARLQRRRAIDDVLVRGMRSPAALRSLFLAACDLASEVALACHHRRSSGVMIWGSGLLSYYVWRLLGINFPDLPVRAFVVPRVEPRPGDALQTMTAADALRAYPEIVCAVTDPELLGIAGAPAGPGPVPATAGWTVVPFVPAEEPVPGVDDALVAAVAEPGWTFRYVSGDQDESLPGPICATYLDGPLKALGGAAASPAFEESFRWSFPLGFRGVD